MLRGWSMSRGRLSSSQVVVPRPERMRLLERARGFGWLDARLVRDGWVSAMTPAELAVYSVLCLVANREGVSWYRRDRLLAMLSIEERELWRALGALEELDLVAYRPFHRNASEGFRQVLSVPTGAER